MTTNGHRWCAYRGVEKSYVGFGIVESNSGDLTTIKISEQKKERLCLYSTHVQKVPTLEDALKLIIDSQPREKQIKPEDLEKRARENFPSYYR